MEHTVIGWRKAIFIMNQILSFKRSYFKNFKIDFHPRKHAANLKHEKEMIKERQQHEVDKLTIALPECLGMVAIICGSVLFIYFKYKLPKIRNVGKSNVPQIELESNSDSIGPALKSSLKKAHMNPQRRKM